MSALYFNQDNLIKNPLIKPYNKTKLNSIVVQFCYNEVIKDKLVLLPVYKTLMLLSGQKPKIIKAKDSIAAFRVRKNMQIGALVTVDYNKYNNLLKYILICLPKFQIHQSSVSLKTFELLNLIDNRIGANVSFNFTSASELSKRFFLSTLGVTKVGFAQSKL
jgi:ribosomal protein L5